MEAAATEAVSKDAVVVDKAVEIMEMAITMVTMDRDPLTSVSINKNRTVEDSLAINMAGHSLTATIAGLVTQVAGNPEARIHEEELRHQDGVDASRKGQRAAHQPTRTV